VRGKTLMQSIKFGTRRVVCISINDPFRLQMIRCPLLNSLYLFREWNSQAYT